MATRHIAEVLSAAIGGLARARAGAAANGRIADRGGATHDGPVSGGIRIGPRGGGDSSIGHGLDGEGEVQPRPAVAPHPTPHALPVRSDEAGELGAAQALGLEVGGEESGSVHAPYCRHMTTEVNASVAT